ncbi:MAG: esterase family protein [Saprospiraceae bacterium]|nr:esterase family protein [Saprospiraceae bacterium]
MTFNKIRFWILSITNLSVFALNAATVDTIDVASPSMNTTYKAAVAIPASYAKNMASYPVLYLLHGANGHFRSWSIRPPNDKKLVEKMADQYNMIIVMPEGEVFGWYYDSPFNKENQFESHVIKEVIPKIDATYRTVKSNKGRVISGLSMGGHGAVYLSTRHPDMFCAAGTMSGAMDMNFSKYRTTQPSTPEQKERYVKLFGSSDPTSAEFVKNSVINMIDAIKKNGLPLIVDCGVDDFLLDVNREFHARLVYNNVPHDYTERPGDHTWAYWENALPYHMIFFQKVLKKHGVTVE